jgi:hypothetical protein
VAGIFKKKNSEGRSFKHVDGPREGHGGSDTENAKVAKKAHRTGPRPGTNTTDKQAPHKQRAKKELKHVDQGDILNDWCSGKRKDYKNGC